MGVANIFVTMVIKMAAVFSLASGDENAENAGQISSSSIKSIVKQLLQGIVKCNVQQPCVVLCTPIAAKVLADQTLNRIKEKSMQPIKTLRETLKVKGVDVNEVESVANGVTILMCCCYLGREDAVKLLVKKGADPSLADVNGWNSLHYAVWGQNVNCIKQLVTRSGGPALINRGDNRGITPLMLAANRCELGTVQWLIKKGGDPLLTDAHQRTLLHWAVTTPTQSDTVRYLLGKHFYNKSEGEGLRVGVDADGASLLHYASVMSSNEVVTLLLTEGFDPLLQTGPAHDPSPYPVPSDEGLTPVHWACAVSRGDVLIGLLEHGKGVVNALSRQQLSPLHVSVCVDSVELSGKLIHNGAMVDTMDSRGLTPLHLSCHYGHTDCSRLLLDKGAAIDTLSTSKGMSSLHLASQRGHHELVGMLVDRGADRDLVTPLDGNSPIHLGAAHGKEVVIETLIKRGCSVDLLRGQDGRSPLHVAASNGHINCCRVLIANGANVNCRDQTSERCGPLDLALINNHRVCVDYLLTCNAITQGGGPHRAVCTIQLWWRYQIHKRRKRITIEWAVRVLQHSFRAWLRRCWARRVRGARERRREVSAILIQRGWREYRMRKRQLEESYRVLRAKLAKEHMTTHFLLSELRLQEATVSLPPRESRTRSHPRSHTTTSLLRTDVQPAPMGPNESLLSQHKPSVSQARVRINTVPHINMGNSRHTLTAPMATQHHTQKFQPSIETQDHTHQQHMSMATKDHIHQPHVLNKLQYNDDKLSRVDSSHQYSLTGPDCVGGSSLPVIRRKSDPTVLTDRPNPKGEQTNAHSTLPPIVRPRPSLVVKKETGWTRMSGRGKERERGVARGTRRIRAGQDKDMPAVSKVSSKDGSSNLINNAQRYHKLQQVAMLLEQAKDVHCKSDSSYEELKSQIQAALEEAIRLRVDVETLK